MDIRDYIKASIDTDRKRLAHFRRQASSQVEGLLKKKINKRNNKVEYYLKLPNDDAYHYVGKKDNKRVLAIKSKKLAEKYVQILEHNIYYKEQVLTSLVSDLYDDVVNLLPFTYRPDPKISGTVEEKRRNRKIKQSENPFRREELKLETSFGLFVRTKGELVIAELLYSLGITFYYERSLTFTVTRFDEAGVPYQIQKTYYPDFTIPMKSGKAIYWEHKGLMKRAGYVERDILKETDYNANGIYQSHNLIVTSEGPNNEIDMDGIMRMVTVKS